MTEPEDDPNAFECFKIVAIATVALTAMAVSIHLLVWYFGIA